MTYWHIDSGCSNHMTGDKNYFVTIDQNVKTLIKLGDGQKEDVAGKGTIAVKTKNGSSKLIHEVFYVPRLAQNLLSVCQLIKKSYMVKFEKNKCQMIKIRVR